MQEKGGGGGAEDGWWNGRRRKEEKIRTRGSFPPKRDENERVDVALLPPPLAFQSARNLALSSASRLAYSIAMSFP